MASDTDFVESTVTSVGPASNMASSLTAEQKRWSQMAHQEYERSRYKECLSALGRLRDSRPDDFKVYLNIAVAELIFSGNRNSDDFRDGLRKAAHVAQTEISNANTLDDPDHCIMFYNYAVLLFHLKQYEAALPIVEKLYHFVQPLEETLGYKVVFLLIDLYLATQQPEKAIDVIAYVEQQLSTKQEPSLSPGEQSENGSLQANWDEIWKHKLCFYKVRTLLMMKALRNCKTELKSLMASANLPAGVVYLKANLEYLRGNHKKASRLINSSPAAPSWMKSGDCVSLMQYNNLGICQMMMGKIHLGLFHMRKAMQECENAIGDLKKAEPGRKPVHLLGISHHHELQYNLGVQLLFCGQPLAAFDCLMEVVQIYQVNPRLWLRLAECCIMHHRVNNDEDRSLERRLRVVESAIGSGLHRKVIMGSGVARPYIPGAESAAVPVASLEFACLCLRNAFMLLPPLAQTESALAEDRNQAFKTNTPASAGDESEAATGDSYVKCSGDLLQTPPSNPMRPSQVQSLRCSILALSSYVSLCLNDPVVALQHANNLLALSAKTPAQAYLAMMYKADALISLDRMFEAIKLLDPTAISSVNTVPTSLQTEPLSPDTRSSDKDQPGSDMAGSSEPISTTTAPVIKPVGVALQQWIPRDLKTARGFMMYNLAAACAIQEDYQKGLTCLEKACEWLGQPYPAQAEFLDVYLLIMLGRKSDALAVLKQRYSHI